MCGTRFREHDREIVHFMGLGDGGVLTPWRRESLRTVALAATTDGNPEIFSPKKGQHSEFTIFLICFRIL